MSHARRTVPARVTLLLLGLGLGACAQDGTTAGAGAGPKAGLAGTDTRSREQMDLDAYGPRRPLGDVLGLNRSFGGGGGGGGGGSYGGAPRRNPNAGMPFGVSPGMGALLFGRI